jgi:hypothetical protein
MTLCKTIGLQCCCQPDDGVPCPFETIEQVAKWGHEWRDAALKAQTEVADLKDRIDRILKSNRQREAELRSYIR